MKNMPETFGFGHCFYRNNPVRNAPSDADKATTIKGSSKNDSISAITVPATAVSRLSVL